MDSLLSEVLSLARLNHQYIVRYYGTWVEELEDTSAIPSNSTSAIASDDEEEEEEEDDTEGDFGDDDLELTFSSRVGRSSSVLPSYDNSFQVDYISTSFDPRIEFDESSEEDDQNEDDDPFVFANSTDDISNNETEDRSKSDSKEVSVENQKMLLTPLKMHHRNQYYIYKWSFVKIIPFSILLNKDYLITLMNIGDFSDNYLKQFHIFIVKDLFIVI